MASSNGFSSAVEGKPSGKAVAIDIDSIFDCMCPDKRTERKVHRYYNYHYYSHDVPCDQGVHEGMSGVLMCVISNLA